MTAHTGPKSLCYNNLLILLGQVLYSTLNYYVLPTNFSTIPPIFVDKYVDKSVDKWG